MAVAADIMTLIAGILVYLLCFTTQSLAVSCRTSRLPTIHLTETAAYNNTSASLGEWPSLPYVAKNSFSHTTMTVYGLDSQEPYRIREAYLSMLEVILQEGKPYGLVPLPYTCTSGEYTLTFYAGKPVNQIVHVQMQSALYLVRNMWIEFGDRGIQHAVIDYPWGPDNGYEIVRFMLVRSMPSDEE